MASHFHFKTFPGGLDFLPIAFCLLQPLHKSLDTDNMEQLITPLTTLGHLAMLAPEQFAAPLKSLVANFIVKDLLMNDRVSYSIAHYGSAI